MKTISLKKVAVVAVASLGFGLMSVVPAQAAAASVTATAVTTSTPAAAIATPATAGSTVTATLALTPNAATAAITTLPVTWTLLDPNGTDVTSSVTFTNAGLAATLTSSTWVANVSTVVIPATGPTAASIVGTASYVPTMGGRYKWRFAVGASTGGDTINAVAVADVTNTPYFYVSGAGAVVASSGIGTSTIGAVTGGIATVRFGTAAHASGDIYNLTTSGVGSIQTVGAGTTTPATMAGIAGTTDFSQGAKITTSADTNMNDVIATVSSAVAGVQTLTWTAISGTTGAPTVVAVATITWGSAGTVSTAFSTAYLNSGNTYAASTPAAGVSLTKTYASTAAVANIGVTLKDNNNTNLLGQKLTVTVSGPGAISVTQGALTTAAATAGLRAVSEATANTGATWMIGINADGTAGTSTITISVGTTVVATRTLTFYGTPSKITATQNYSIARAGSAGYELGDSRTNTTATTGYVPAVSVYVEDASANAVAATVTCLPADLTVISGCTIAADDNATYGAGTGYYNASVTSAPNGVSGKSTTVVFRTLLSTGAYVTSAPVTFTLGGSVVSTAVTLNKTSYAPGEAMVLTVTTKDASGNPSYDGQGILGSISANKSVGGALPAITKVFANGKYATSATAPTLFAPALSGAFTISGVSVATTAAPLGVAYSVSASVTDANAGLMTQIDALNAKIIALNALIAKIMKKLGVK